jgi:hypothetical protein
MAILQRVVHVIRPDKGQEFDEWMNKWIEFTDSHGFPTMTRYSYMSGTHPNGTIVAERLWESFAECEKAFVELYKNPEAAVLDAPCYELVKEMRTEFLMKME